MVQEIEELTTMAIDPICEMDVDEKTAKWTSDYNGKKFYFCAPGCKKMFDKEPEKWSKAVPDMSSHGHSCGCGHH